MTVGGFVRRNTTPFRRSDNLTHRAGTPGRVYGRPGVFALTDHASASIVAVGHTGGLTMNDVSRIGAMSRVEAEGFDYQAEADKTCSPHWNPQNVEFYAFRRTLVQFIDLCGVLNAYYKVLLRGKSPDDFNLKTPAECLSLAGYGGSIPANEIDLVHGILGSATEVGELVEILLRLIDGKSPDRVNAVEEVGDMRWFLNRVLRWAGSTDLECEMANIDKLHGRHGSSFDLFRDANRDLERERERLELSVDRTVEEAPTLPLGPEGDEEPDHFERRPIGDIPGMDC